MLVWAIASAACVTAGAVSLAAAWYFARRERRFHAWMREEMDGLKGEIDEACRVRESAPPSERGDILEKVESDDIEISGNLDKMNSLLDQLNGLLKGKRVPRRKDFHLEFNEEETLMGLALDFTSPEELRRFEGLPPIREEEVKSMDWDYLFNRIRTDDITDRPAGPEAA